MSTETGENRLDFRRIPYQERSRRMECLGPQGVLMLLDWLKERSKNTRPPPTVAMDPGPPRRPGLLFRSTPYREDAPSIRSTSELEGALEHLEYSVHRRFHNQLTRENGHGSITPSTTHSSRSNATSTARTRRSAPQ